jgi:cysteinyl-tRNA synthetase
MAGALLGPVFDIHGGGIDLTFPHHENEIAQSRCAHGTPVMANVWMHNGFLQVEGEKMSKSLGNFVTINELLETNKFGGREWPGEVLRLAMLMTHYRQPIDWTEKSLREARLNLLRWADAVRGADPRDARIAPGVLAALENDLNTPEAIGELHRLAKVSKSTDPNDNPIEAMNQLVWALNALGFEEHQRFLKEDEKLDQAIDIAIQAHIEKSIYARLEARKRKDFAESDRIRDELAKMGISLKDTKNKETGEIETTWEVAR